MTHGRPCLDCAGAGDLPLVYETGEMHGWLCRYCEDKRRRKRMGWKRRVSIRVRRWLQV
jgi:hypothetical protein